MKDKSLRALMIDDSEDDILLINRELRKGGYDPVYERVDTPEAMKMALQERSWDIILCDYTMPKFNAPSAIALFKQTGIDIPFIIVSGTIGEETAIECMRLGAHDYLMKGKLSRLCPAINRELGEAENRRRQKQAESQREAALQALHQSEEKYRTILENMDDGYYEVDLTGNYTFFNDSICRMHGYSRSEIMGMNYRKFVDPDYAKRIYEAFHAVYTKGEPMKGFDWQIIKKDGAKRYIESSVSLRKDSSGNTIGFRGTVHDITERKQAEEALKKSEAMYRLLADNISEHVWIMDLNLKLVYISPSAEKLYGYSLKELRKISFQELFTEESVQKLSEMYKTALDLALVNPPPPPGTRRMVELQARHKDGHLLWTENSVHFIRDENGQPVSLMGETRDITDRKLAQEMLKKSEEQYRLLADHMKDQVWLMDMNLNITYVSPSVERLLGYSLEEIKTLPLEKLLAPESLKKAMDFVTFRMPKAIKNSFKDFIFRTLELEFVLKNGQTAWTDCSFSFIRDESNNPVSIIGEARNISERKIAEAKLQQTLESLRKAIGTTIQVLIAALEARDPYTAGHQSQSAELACAIATEMGLPSDTIEGIRMAGAIHDIGKLSIPAEILTKPTKLTDLEYELIKEHPKSGYEMLKNVESPWPLAQIVYQHHERINGTGYPKKLKGEEIILEARIMAVADVVDAMASHRPYRASLGMEAALNEIAGNKGILYDPNVVEACIKLIREKGYQLERNSENIPD